MFINPRSSPDKYTCLEQSTIDLYSLIIKINVLSIVYIDKCMGEQKIWTETQ